MAIAPIDPRHPDLTASDILSPQVWPKREVKFAGGLDVICTKIAVDFQMMRANNALDTITANLELLRDAARVDAAFHITLDTEVSAFNEIQVARGLLSTGNPEQLRSQPVEAMPWLQSRLAHLRVSELRDTSTPREDQLADAGQWNHLGIGSVLLISYHIEGKPAGILGIA